MRHTLTPGDKINLLLVTDRGDNRPRRRSPFAQALFQSDTGQRRQRRRDLSIPSELSRSSWPEVANGNDAAQGGGSGDVTLYHYRGDRALCDVVRGSRAPGPTAGL